MTTILYKAIVIGVSGSQLKLFILYECKSVDINFGPGQQYSLVNAVDLGDIVELSERGGDIRRVEQGGNVPEIVYQHQERRPRIQIKLNFMPLSYYLFPATAKQKGLRMAYTKELGPVPIANENQLELHKFYQGHATFYLTKNQIETSIERNYETPWIILKPRPIETERRILEHQHGTHIGLVVDDSAQDAFFVHIDDGIGLVSMRKSVAQQQQIKLGDWINFVGLAIKEAEKSDENLEIFPSDIENMTFFDRRVAISPLKLQEVPHKTLVNQQGQIELIVELHLPSDQPYWVVNVGAVHDPDGHIRQIQRKTTVTVRVQCHVQLLGSAATFNIIDVMDFKDEEPAPTRSVARNGNFLDRLEQAQQGRRRNGATAAVRPPSPTPTPRVSASPSPPQPMESSAPVQRRELSLNHVKFDGVVVDVGNRGGRQVALCFCGDMSLGDRNIIRLGLNDIDTLPLIGQWVRIIMKIVSRGRRNDLELWGADLMDDKLETEVTRNGSEKVVMIRTQLKLKDNGELFSETLGTVSNIEQRLDTTGFGPRKAVTIWCRKIMPLRQCEGGIHWEVAPLPEPEWDLPDSRTVATPAVGEKRTVFPYGYVGSRYRKKPAENTEQAQQQQTSIVNNNAGNNIGDKMTFFTAAMTTKTTSPTLDYSTITDEVDKTSVIVCKPNAPRRPLTAAAVASSSPTTDYNSGFESSDSSAGRNSRPPTALMSLPEPEQDLIDLFSEQCAIAPQQQQKQQRVGAVQAPVQQQQVTTSTVPRRHEQKEEDLNSLPYMGVVASKDESTEGYYIYSNEFDKELYLGRQPKPIEKGTWIKFNTSPGTPRLTVGQYSSMKNSPFMTRPTERNSICMQVTASITQDTLRTRDLTTDYIKNAHDWHGLITPIHCGKRVLLEVKRKRRGDYLWHVSRVVQIVRD